MGSFGVSVTGNDLARDLLLDYKVAFYFNDIETALQKIDEYAKQVCDEDEPVELCHYIYSLADFMWKKGILTDDVKQKALELIDSEYGLQPYMEAGVATLNKRKEVLKKLKEQLLSEQPKKKKINIDLYINPIFEIGDLVAFQLQTKNKEYPNNCILSEKEFHECDGRYVVFKKVGNQISYTSKIDSRAKDIWPVFQIYKKVFDDIPTIDVLNDVPFASIQKFNDKLDMIYCEGNMYYFKKRNYTIIGNDKSKTDNINITAHNTDGVYFQWKFPTGTADLKIINCIFGE